MYSPIAGALTLDEYIKKLQDLAAEHGGNVKVITVSSGYPKPGTSPHYVHKGYGYIPSGTVVLE